jgi:hypothetical protein
MRQLLSLGIARLADCPTATTLAILVLGLFSGGVAYLTNALLMRVGTSGVVYAVIDATVIGAVAATIGALALIGVRERRKRDIERLRTVAELNHHVRNALQVIVDDYYLSRDSHTEAVLSSVDRIDRTLRSLFPAEPAVAQVETKPTVVIKLRTRTRAKAA